MTGDGSVRLLVDVYDRIARAKGYRSRAAQARWHGIAKSALFRIVGGGEPAIRTAVKMAADLGVPFEAIWERIA